MAISIFCVHWWRAPECIFLKLTCQIADPTGWAAVCTVDTGSIHWMCICVSRDDQIVKNTAGQFIFVIQVEDWENVPWNCFYCITKLINDEMLRLIPRFLICLQYLSVSLIQAHNCSFILHLWCPALQGLGALHNGIRTTAKLFIFHKEATIQENMVLEDNYHHMPMHNLLVKMLKFLLQQSCWSWVKNLSLTMTCK